MARKSVFFAFLAAALAACGPSQQELGTNAASTTSDARAGTDSLTAAGGASDPAARQSSPEGPEVEITVLTTNAADGVGQGEWSFAAWVVVDGRAFLFDTGWSPDNVLRNAEALGIDLSAAEDLVLSHNHMDHTGGLETLRTELSKRNPAALSRIHVAAGIFLSRPTPDGGERNNMPALRARIEATGATFVVHDQPAEIAPSVWVTGPISRIHPETNYPTAAAAVLVRDGVRELDVIPESQSLVVLGAEGPVLVSGCGHAGIVNTLDYVAERISERPPQATLGGFHLADADDEVLAWTAEALAERGVSYFLGSHCTGFEPVYRIRELAAMRRGTAVVGAIGTRFTPQDGIIPGLINR